MVISLHERFLFIEAIFKQYDKIVKKLVDTFIKFIKATARYRLGIV